MFLLEAALFASLDCSDYRSGLLGWSGLLGRSGLLGWSELLDLSSGVSLQPLKLVGCGPHSLHRSLLCLLIFGRDWRGAVDCIL